MNFKHFHYVMTVLGEGSITAASKKLFVSQPALSQTIKQIEQDLGTPIFDRSTDPISLTFAGRKYIDAQQRMLDIDQNMRAEIADAKDEVRGCLRIGIAPQRSIQLLPLVVPEFSQRYPHVKLEVMEHGSEILERMTAEGKCDFSLITTNVKPGRLSYILIENEEIVLIASRQTELARRFPDGTPISLREAANEPFVLLGEDHSIRFVQDRLLEQNHLTPRVILETTNLEAAKHTAARAGAVMLCPRGYINNMDLQSRVQCHPIQDNDYERHFYLCFRQGMMLTHCMEDFIRIVCGKLNVPFNMPGQEE